MNKEVWKTLPSNHRYEVSSFGRLRNVKTGRLLKLSQDKDGYLDIALYNGQKYDTKRIHRLVCETFFGPNDLSVNHKDGNKSNNSITNLEYCTISENIKHAIVAGLRNDNHLKEENEKRKQSVLQIDENNVVVSVFESQREAARETGIAQPSISRAVKTGAKCNGFYWRKQ